jgi:hypothetical protein
LKVVSASQRNWFHSIQLVIYISALVGLVAVNVKFEIFLYLNRGKGCPGKQALRNKRILNT